jgi:hypothetical protein
MEINPYDSRLRMLQQIDTVAMQREAAPDEETAGCPGCPYFWTCPVPHRGEEVRAPQELALEEVREVPGPRRAFVPRDESDVGWTDVWLDEDGSAAGRRGGREELRRMQPAAGEGPEDGEQPEEAARRPRWWRRRRR